ncbi:hypothetical protein GWR56_04605 [Mucilaginibacter sp. 14171R-50]|uniref:hypothetical protein n=1 Tax=Mucilaginibacter sp. 14171R-50 TaxID=2703789 RepID=UPI00138D1EBC|nr:hypothetical protein [Mucilaginibacter sp. 14171R-50]QHS54863.1 hypothetical protein GWR56_04605 [Mucilaginibacter sp. 14171R-50]
MSFNFERLICRLKISVKENYFRYKVFLLVSMYTSAIYPAKAFVLFLLVLVFSSAQSYGSPTDTSVFQNGTDTGKVAARVVNRDFNNIYIQNLKPSFFGQELFQPVKTKLVGDVNAHFVLLNTPKSRFFFDLSARVKLRLLSAYGEPVKSPSYMPSGNLYYRLNRDAYKPQFLQLSYTHHSNGVRGPTLKPDGGFNRDSGKFSTDFYSLNYTIGKRVDNPNNIINHYSTIGIELHRGLFGDDAAMGLPGSYGFVRVNGGYIYNIAKRYQDDIDADASSFKNWQRIQFDFTYIADKYRGYDALNLKERLNVSLKYYYQFPFMQNVSFIVGGGYRGQDDYNIYFEDSYAYVQFGIASGLNFLFHKD